jgi:hypothetical protein
MYILLCIGWSIFRSAGFPAWRERGILFALNVAYICSWRVIIPPWFATIRRRPLISSNNPILLGGKIFTYISSISIQLAWQMILNEWIGPLIVWLHSPHLNTSKGGLQTSAWWGRASGVGRQRRVVHHKPQQSLLGEAAGLTGICVT